MRTDLFLRLAAVCCMAASARAEAPLRVCANSDNFPLSNSAGEGFENKLAQLVATKLGTTVSYTWWPARENFLDRTLKKGRCDVVMGVPAGLDGIDTTRPYYRSSYVFLSRADAHLGLSSLKDPRLKTLAIGVYLIGDEQTPPAMALSQQGINANVHGFMTFFDRDGRSSGLVNAVSNRAIAVAAVWGPLIGYYARHSAVPLAIEPINDTSEFAPLAFRYDIALGVRRGDSALRDKLDQVIADNKPEIEQLLRDYGVPLLPVRTAGD